MEILTKESYLLLFAACGIVYPATQNMPKLARVCLIGLRG